MESLRALRPTALLVYWSLPQAHGFDTDETIIYKMKFATFRWPCIITSKVCAIRKSHPPIAKTPVI